MDALLRYSLYQIAYSILFLEIFLMIFFAIAIVCTKTITKWNQRRRADIKLGISSIIQSALLSEESDPNVVIPKKLQHYRDLVEILEEFNYRFNSDKWNNIKEKVIAQYLKPMINSYAHSFTWFKRLLAARTYLLNPSGADEKILERFLNDSKYLVRVTAASCIIQGSNQPLFYKVINQMSHET